MGHSDNKNRAVFISHPVPTNAEAFVEECRHNSTGKGDPGGADNPLSNTGYLAPKTCCLDYLKLGINIDLFSENAESTFARSNLLRFLRLEGASFDESSGGKYFDKQRTYDENVYMFGGFKQRDQSSELSVVELKGQALRMLEVRGVDYFELFSFLIENGFYCLRIDLPVDDFTGLISCGEIESKIKLHCYQSRLVSKSVKVDYACSSQASEDRITIDTRCHGWTCTIGGVSSRQLCIYDKKAEREYRKQPYSGDHWMRYESRFFHDTAQMVFLDMYEAMKKGNDAVSALILGLMRGLIEFKSRKSKSLRDSRHINRANIWGKWKSFVEDNRPVFVANQGKMEGTITRRKNWFDRSVTNTCVKLICCGGLSFLKDISKSCTNEKHLRSVLTSKNLAEINNDLRGRGLSPLDFDDVREIMRQFSDFANFGVMPDYDPPEDSDNGRTSDQDGGDDGSL